MLAREGSIFSIYSKICFHPDILMPNLDPCVRFHQDLSRNREGVGGQTSKDYLYYDMISCQHLKVDLQYLHFTSFLFCQVLMQALPRAFSGCFQLPAAFYRMKVRPFQLKYGQKCKNDSKRDVKNQGVLLLEHLQ